jgi:phenylacetate-CoA ligase
MSAYHLSSDNSRAYLDQILKFKPEVLCSFPTMALLLAKYFRAHQIGYSFDAVFTSSEYLEPFIRHYVEETFQTRIYDWYGQAERVAVLGQCRYGTYHVQEDYSLVELVPGKNGDEIIGSHLHNFIMPLLRYRTGDHVIPSQGGCACGHSSRAVERIVGRSPEMLITPEGYHIVCAPAFVFKGIESVIEAQFYQEKPGEVVIKVITKNGLSEPDRDVLIKNTLRYTSPHMRINIEEVPKIERGPNGKYLSVINKCMSLYDSDFMCPETAPMAIKNT